MNASKAREVGNTLNIVSLSNRSRDMKRSTDSLQPIKSVSPSLQTEIDRVSSAYISRVFAASAWILANDVLEWRRDLARQQKNILIDAWGLSHK